MEEEFLGSVYDDVATRAGYLVVILLSLVARCSSSLFSSTLTMRTVLLGRFCLGRGLPRIPRHHFTPSWRPPVKRIPRRAPVIGGVVMATLAPGAFLKLAEDSDGHGMTGEMQMLEASREEIRKVVPTDARGLSRLCQSIGVLWYHYVYDPIATGFRFLHLVVIFMPVVVTVPAIWIGRRIENRNNARSGTLWWYRFLVKAMERAGPAFIKVGSSFIHLNSLYRLADRTISRTAGAMGRV